MNAQCSGTSLGASLGTIIKFLYDVGGQVVSGEGGVHASESSTLSHKPAETAC